MRCRCIAPGPQTQIPIYGFDRPKKGGLPPVERRFAALRIIAIILKIFAWIFLILGLLGGVALLILGFTLLEPLGIPTLETGGPLVGIAAFVVILIITLAWFLSLYAGADLILLFLSVEENTRRMAYLQQQYIPQPPGYGPQPPPPAYNE